MQSTAAFVEVAVFSPLPGSFTYSWPQALGAIEPGVRVRIPFGNGMRTGLLLGPASNVDPAIELKPVADRLDAEPLFDAARMRWLARVCRYYLAQPGEFWSVALGWAGQDELRRYRCADRDALTPALADAFKTRAAISLKTIAGRLEDARGLHWRLAEGVVSGALMVESPQPIWRGIEAVKQPPLTPTEQQRRAIDAIVAAAGQFNPFLLFGRTGSGKTEVYLQAAARAVAAGGQVLVLVPEIGLTPMWLNRLRARFEKVALWHSAMTGPERLAVREHLADTEVLIGTRSALFLPLPRLAMIVVDEEHDASFKQQEGMHYSARDAALLLAQDLKLPIVLGSATPSLESWRQVEEGVYQRLDLPERIAANSTMSPETVDMRGIESPLSEPMLEAMRATLAAGEQSILFLNRRGYAPALQCTACGDVSECPDCSLRLTLHRRAGTLRCHACGFRRRVPKSCEVCGEQAFMPMGEGTEKLEELLSEELPGLRFARFDRDAITSHSRLEETLARFERGELDCLLGTQMLVKGHDFPNVTLVGVVNADLGISMPDFRAGERWWQQMTQVTGRAGRGGKPGRVIVQTRMPEAVWLPRIGEAAAEATLNEEMELRKMLSFPPFARWVRVVFSAARTDAATQLAMQFARHCEQIEGISISGPMPCALERMAGKSRIEVLLRDPTRKILPWKLAPLLEGMNLPRDVRMRIDVDPQDMM